MSVLDQMKNFDSFPVIDDKNDSFARDGRLLFFSRRGGRGLFECRPYLISL